MGLYWSDTGYLLPDVLAAHVGEHSYVDRLTDILRKERVDLLLVGTDFEVPILARHREEIERAVGTRVVVSSPPVAQIANDKWETCRFLGSHGLSFPRSTVDLREMEAFVASVGFPLIVKPRTGFRSRHVHRVYGWPELRAALKTGPGPIVQEYVGDPETGYTCGAVVVDGSCLGVISMRRDLKDGNTHRAHVRDFSEIDEVVARATLDPLGPVNFQIRLAKSCPVFLEINARFSGTTFMRALVGFNEVEAVVQAVVLKERPLLRRKADGVILRYWEEMLVPWSAYERWGHIPRRR